MLEGSTGSSPAAGVPTAASDLVRQAADNAARYDYHRDGFAISPGPLFTPEEVDELSRHADRVLAGDYETGVAPRTNTGGSDASKHVGYIESQMPQDADDVIARAIRNPRIGQWVARITGAKRLKVWTASVMKKYPGEEESDTIVGWHQDRRYSDLIVQGKSVNIWIALCDVSEDLGPVRFVPRSNQWDRRFETGFFDRDVDRQRSEFDIPEGEEWTEVEAVLPAGWASAHSIYTLHGSSGNRGDRPRLSLLISAAIDDFQMVPGRYFETRQDDDRATPVIYPAVA